MAPKKTKAEPGTAGAAKPTKKSRASGSIDAASADVAANHAHAQSPFGQLQADHLVKVHEALAKVRSCVIFQGLSDESPLSIKDGGSQSPFCQKDMAIALSGGEKTLCTDAPATSSGSTTRGFATTGCRSTEDKYKLFKSLTTQVVTHRQPIRLICMWLWTMRTTR